MLTLPRLLRSLRLGREEGQVMPMFAAGIGAMLIMTGVVIDGGNLFQNRQSLQNAADAAAVAAAEYTADHTKTCVVGATDPVGSCAGQYASLNHANGARGDSSTPLCTSASPNACALPLCNSGPGLAVSDTQPPTKAPGCYLPNYGPQQDEVEVWLTRDTSNFLGGILGVGTSTESARAVGGLAPGPPPRINFASLFDGCNAHTLLIKAGGTLTVNQTIYANSCNAPNDAFDVFGGGSIRAPEIDVVGGWETHNGSTVFTSHGTPADTWPNVYQCPLVSSKSLDLGGTPAKWSVPPNGCPIDGATKLNDPFASLPAPVTPAIAPGASSLVTHKGRQSGTATVVTSPPLNAYPGSTVVVAGMDDSTFNTPLSGSQVTSNNGNLFSYANAGIDVPSTAVAQANVFSGSIRNYVVTLNLSSGVSLCVGDAITVQNVDAIANGTFSIISVNNPDPNGCNSSTTTIKYNDTNAAASTTYEKGGPPGTPSFSTETLASCGSAATCTATIGGLSVNASVHAGDEIDVSNATDEPTFDGSYLITADSSGTSVSYRPEPFIMTFQSDSIANGIATLTILGPDDPPASLADVTPATINVSSNDPRFDGSQTVKSSSPTADTVTYQLPSITWTGAVATFGEGLATVTTGTTTGLQPGDTIKVSSGSAGTGCLAGGHTYPVVGSDATSVSYQVATTCRVNSSSATGTIVIESASGDDVNGTAQVKTNNASPANLSIVVVPVDKTFTVGSNSNVSVLTVPATSGIATVLNSGTSSLPKPYEVPFGNVHLSPGTYYGGICIGAAVGKDCTGTNCNNTITSSANVTMNPGTYYIAGGGFHVCGGSSLSAPHVLIYNTQDTGHSGAATAAYWKIGQVQLNTTGIVTMGPQTSGLYSGMTIFQDRGLVLTHDGPTTSNDDCNAKSGKPSEWDIAFESMGDPGTPSHALGGITGTIYAPKEYTSGSPQMGEGADFGLQVSGTTTLAVFTSCIFINGANDVFNYSSDPTQLFGLGATLAG